MSDLTIWSMFIHVSATISVPPHTMFYTSRLFRPKQEDKSQESHDMSFKDGRDEQFGKVFFTL